MRRHLAWLAVLAIALPSLGGAQQRGGSAASQHGQTSKLYRWTDDKGVVHYGDSVPPEYAKQDRSVLNSQGVNVGFEQGELTAGATCGEGAPRGRGQAGAAQARGSRAQGQDAARDVHLRLRHRGLAQSPARAARGADQSDGALPREPAQASRSPSRTRRATTSRTPRATNAPQIPENLATDISRTVGSINLYEQTLSRTRSDQEMVRTAFDDDIRRFKQLKGG